jgi:hypothetical protein
MKIITSEQFEINLRAALKVALEKVLAKFAKTGVRKVRIVRHREKSFAEIAAATLRRYGGKNGGGRK